MSLVFGAIGLAIMVGLLDVAYIAVLRSRLRRLTAVEDERAATVPSPSQITCV